MAVFAPSPHMRKIKIPILLFIKLNMWPLGSKTDHPSRRDRVSHQGVRRAATVSASIRTLSLGLLESEVPSGGCHIPARLPPSLWGLAVRPLRAEPHLWYIPPRLSPPPDDIAEAAPRTIWWNPLPERRPGEIFHRLGPRRVKSSRRWAAHSCCSVTLEKSKACGARSASARFDFGTNRVTAKGMKLGWYRRPLPVQLFPLSSCTFMTALHPNKCTFWLVCHSTNKLGMRFLTQIVNGVILCFFPGFGIRFGS